MELLFALFMTEKELVTNNSVSSKDSPVGRGYLPLTNLSEKYGYAKDYLGWLSRTGRIEAVRHGKYGQWYGSEESLKKYQLSLISPLNSKTIPPPESQPAVSESKSEPPPELRKTSVLLPVETPPLRIEQLQVKVPTVLLLPLQDNSFTEEENTVLCKNDGSYSADLGVGSRRSEVSNPGNSVGLERINAILTLSIVLGGILFFTQIIYPVDLISVITAGILKANFFTLLLETKLKYSFLIYCHL